MRQSLETPIETEKASNWLSSKLDEITASSGSHPCLSDRLKALGQDGQIPPPVKENAAIVYLGENTISQVIESLNKEWRKNVENFWKEHYQDTQQKRQELKDLRQKARAGTLSAEEHVYYGLLAERFEGLSVATQIFAKAQTLHNTYAPALYHYGRVLLEQKKAEGIDFINQAMDNDWDIVISGAGLVCQYLVEAGKEEEAKNFFNKAAARWQEIELAREERAVLRLDSNFVEHGLSEEEVSTLVDQLKNYPDVAFAYLARVEVKHHPEYPLYVLAYSNQSNEKKFSKSNDNLQTKLIEQTTYPGECWIIALTKENRQLNRIKRIHGSLIYQRTK